jgi:hypothetical protein
MPEPGDHQLHMREALEREGEAHRRLLAGEREAARAAFRGAADAYRRSWEAAGPAAYGRLIGMLKAALLGGGAAEAAAYVRAQVGDERGSPPSWYALGLAALVEDDDDLARRAAGAMRGGDEAFGRGAEAISALADRDGERYQRALGAIVSDFEGRAEHLNGVAIADTALVLEALAEPRGMAVRPRSRVLPS